MAAPDCTRIVPPGSHPAGESSSRRAYTNHAFTPSAPPPPYDASPSSYDCGGELSLPRYSSLSYPVQPQSRPRRPLPKRPSPRNVFVLWVTIILVPTVIFVGTLAVILIACE